MLPAIKDASEIVKLKQPDVAPHKEKDYCNICGRHDRTMYFRPSRPHCCYCPECASDDMIEYDASVYEGTNLLDREGEEIIDIMYGREEEGNSKGEKITFHSAIKVRRADGSVLFFCDFDDPKERRLAQTEGYEI